MLFLLSGCGGKDEESTAAPVQQQGSNALQPILDIANKASDQSSNPARLSTLTPAVLFQTVQVGDDLTMQVVLTNDGDQDLKIDKIELGGAGDVFSLGGACMENGSLGPERSSCRLEVTFRPLTAQPYNTKIIVTHNAAGSPLTIDTSGTGQAPPPPVAVAPRAPNELELYASRMMQQRRGRPLQVITPTDLVSSDVTMEDADYSSLGIEKTISTYPVRRDRLITADRYIPAVLENTINSSLSEGRCVGVVENHVYSAEGQNILIPAGSRIIGRYTSLSRSGQERLEVIWYRLLRPDGVNIDIQSTAADVMGRQGMIGHVDKRYFDRYAMPLLLSTISIAANYATSPDTVTETSYTDVNGNVLGNITNEARSRENAAVRQFSSELLDLSRKIIQENIDIAPIVTVPAGTRFLIIPSRDIELKRPSLMTAAGPAYDLVAKARNLINTLQRGELDAAGLRLAEVMSSAAQVGMVNEGRGFANNPYTSPAIASGANSYAPPTTPELMPNPEPAPAK
jgi:hypothetical protein